MFLVVSSSDMRFGFEYLFFFACPIFFKWILLAQKTRRLERNLWTFVIQDKVTTVAAA